MLFLSEGLARFPERRFIRIILYIFLTFVCSPSIPYLVTKFRYLFFVYFSQAVYFNVREVMIVSNTFEHVVFMDGTAIDFVGGFFFCLLIYLSIVTDYAAVLLL